MQFNFDCKFKELKDMGFHFGNIDSPYSANNLYFTKNSKPFLPVVGELHFSRLPRKFWKRELLKMKDSGLNAVSTYVFWNYHQPDKYTFNFKGDNDISAFLSICSDIDLPCILRIGPWCHGEVVRGGLPKFINRMIKKRGNYTKYLDYVRVYWKRLFDEVKPYLDGKTVIGIQLENEYTGKTEHIRTLRKIAEEIGFKTPFFTMTAWPSNNPEKDLLGLTGGYPEAPWTQNKKPLPPKNRFAISSAKTEADIGEDLIKSDKGNEDKFTDYPYASCELGPGNQVTQHRRPIISENDGYGVGFSRFASGMNWLGYYMYHGGRNPNDKPMQESRITGYPNNYPVIDYDFQAPISRYGDCRSHGDRLRLLHLFINTFDKDIAVKQAFFPFEQRKSVTDISMPSCSVRMDENGSGYFFACAYERGLEFKDYSDVSAVIKYEDKKLNLPGIDIKKNSMFFYPFNIKMGNTKFDYIIAQPITKTESDGKTILYFMAIDGIAPKLKTENKEINLPIDEIGYNENNIQIIVLSKEKAMQLHYFKNKVFFEKGTVYCDGETISSEIKNEDSDLKQYVSLHDRAKANLPFGYYLYSHGKRKYYTLGIDKTILNNHYDIELVFEFSGLNLQLFCGKTLIDDYFNTDGRYVIRLREFEEYIKSGEELILKTVPLTKLGIGNVYNEINLKPGENNIKLIFTKKITLEEIELNPVGIMTMKY